MYSPEWLFSMICTSIHCEWMPGLLSAVAITNKAAMNIPVQIFYEHVSSVPLGIHLEEWLAV